MSRGVQDSHFSIKKAYFRFLVSELYAIYFMIWDGIAHGVEMGQKLK